MSITPGRAGYELAPGNEVPISGGRHAIGRPRTAVVVALVLFTAVVATLLWARGRLSGSMTPVRFVNDTSAAVSLSPCGSKARCVIEPGASVVRKPPSEREWWRVEYAATHKPLGCIRNTGERTVRLSATELSGDCWISRTRRRAH